MKKVKGLENNVLENQTSTMKYSGVKYPIDAWNAWFVGFMEENDNKIYFAIYLDDVQNKEIVSGDKAKEIAISILNNEG